MGRDCASRRHCSQHWPAAAPALKPTAAPGAYDRRLPPAAAPNHGAHGRSEADRAYRQAGRRRQPSGANGIIGIQLVAGAPPDGYNPHHGRGLFRKRSGVSIRSSRSTSRRLAPIAPSQSRLRARRAAFAADQDRSRPDRLRQSESGQAQLRRIHPGSLQRLSGSSSSATSGSTCCTGPTKHRRDDARRARWTAATW